MGRVRPSMFSCTCARPWAAVSSMDWHRLTDEELRWSTYLLTFPLTCVCNSHCAQSSMSGRCRHWHLAAPLGAASGTYDSMTPVSHTARCPSGSMTRAFSRQCPQPPPSHVAFRKLTQSASHMPLWWPRSISEAAGLTFAHVCTCRRSPSSRRASLSSTASQGISRCRAALRTALLCFAAMCFAVLCCAVLCCAVLCCAAHCCAALAAHCCAAMCVLCCPVLSCAVLLPRQLSRLACTPCSSSAMPLPGPCCQPPPQPARVDRRTRYTPAVGATRDMSHVTKQNAVCSCRQAVAQQKHCQDQYRVIPSGAVLALGRG